MEIAEEVLTAVQCGFKAQGHTYHVKKIYRMKTWYVQVGPLAKGLWVACLGALFPYLPYSQDNLPY